MAYTKPASLKILISLFRSITGLSVYRPIWMGRKKYNKEAHEALKSNNTKMMIKYLREWIDKCERDIK